MKFLNFNVKKWWNNASIYAIYLRSFNDSNGDGIGDLNGVTGKLEYIKSLGIDAILLSPFYDSPMNDNGYDIRDYEKVSSEYGTLGDFEALIGKAKELQIKVIIDLVLNHTSDEHGFLLNRENLRRIIHSENIIYGKKLLIRIKNLR